MRKKLKLIYMERKKLKHSELTISGDSQNSIYANICISNAVGLVCLQNLK